MGGLAPDGVFAPYRPGNGRRTGRGVAFRRGALVELTLRALKDLGGESRLMVGAKLRQKMVELGGPRTSTSRRT